MCHLDNRYIEETGWGLPGLSPGHLRQLGKYLSAQPLPKSYPTPPMTNVMISERLSQSNE